MLKDPPPGTRAIEVGDGVFTWVDEEDYLYLSKYKWTTIKTHHKLYVVRLVFRQGYFRYIRMHRVIMRPSQGEQTHHKSGVTLDNQKENLENLLSKVHSTLHGGFRHQCHECKKQ